MNAIWASVLHYTVEWASTVMNGKRVLESGGQGIEDILLELVVVI